MGATDIAEVFATGTLWLKVPETLKIVLSGKLRDRVSAKDVILFFARITVRWRVVQSSGILRSNDGRPNLGKQTYSE